MRNARPATRPAIGPRSRYLQGRIEVGTDERKDISRHAQRGGLPVSCTLCGGSQGRASGRPCIAHGSAPHIAPECVHHWACAGQAACLSSLPAGWSGLPPPICMMVSTSVILCMSLQGYRLVADLNLHHLCRQRMKGAWGTATVCHESTGLL